MVTTLRYWATKRNDKHSTAMDQLQQIQILTPKHMREHQQAALETSLAEEEELLNPSLIYLIPCSVLLEVVNVNEDLSIHLEKILLLPLLLPSLKQRKEQQEKYLSIEWSSMLNVMEPV